MAEVALIPDSEMMGKTVREIAFRTRFGLNIVGMKRDGKAMDGSVVDEPLQLRRYPAGGRQLAANCPAGEARPGFRGAQYAG